MHGEHRRETALTRTNSMPTGHGEPPPAENLYQLGTRLPLPSYLREVWRRRDFAIVVPLADLRARHMDTVFGQLWHLLNPALLVAVYFLIFGVILHTKRGIDHFLAFLTIGTMMFQFMQRTALDGASTIASNEGLLRSIQFPRVLLPLSALVFQVAAFVPALFVIIFVTLASGVTPEISWLMLVPVLLLLVAFNFGMVLVVSRLADRFRDIEQILPFFFRILMYVSGILFSVDHYVQSALGRKLWALNPVYSFISLARGALLGMPVGKIMWASVLAWSAVLLVGGFVFFRAAEQHYGRG